MFWLLWLPLFIFVGLLVTWAIFARDEIDFPFALKLALYSFLIFAFFGGMGTLIAGVYRPAESVTTNPSKPVYLSPLLGENDTSGKYLVSLGGSQNQSYSFYYFDPNTGVKRQETYHSDSAPIIYDSPEEPYYLRFIVNCPKNNFWVIGCSPEERSIELHLPQDSIVN